MSSKDFLVMCATIVRLHHTPSRPISVWYHRYNVTHLTSKIGRRLLEYTNNARSDVFEC